MTLISGNVIKNQNMTLSATLSATLVASSSLWHVSFFFPSKRGLDRQCGSFSFIVLYYPSKTSSDGTTILEHAAASRGGELYSSLLL